MSIAWRGSSARVISENRWHSPLRPLTLSGSLGMPDSVRRGTRTPLAPGSVEHCGRTTRSATEGRHCYCWCSLRYVETTPGADDNASAVAVLIETARLVRDLNPACTIRFVSFACEEPPHFYTGDMGSQVYARQCKLRDERIVGMLCLEMVGYYSTKPDSQQIPPGIPRCCIGLFQSEAIFWPLLETCVPSVLPGAFVAGSNERFGFRCFQSACRNRFPRFDYPTTARSGIRAIRRSCLRTRAFYEIRNYHLASDTPDTLDYERMARVTLGVVGGVRRIAS